VPDPLPDPAAAGAGRLRGLGASAGTATGPAYRLAEPPRLPAVRAVADPDTEVDRACAAIDAVRRDTARRASNAADPTSAEILRVQAALAGDRTLRDGVATAVRAGYEAPHAVAAGWLLAARAADLDDLRDRVVARCLGLPMPALPDPGHPYVLIAADLAPADAALLDPARVLAVVTSAGSFISHTAILARAKGLPTVVACGGALDIPDGTVITVDGTTGRVTVGAAVQPAPATPPPPRHRHQVPRPDRRRPPKPPQPTPTPNPADDNTAPTNIARPRGTPPRPAPVLQGHADRVTLKRRPGPRSSGPC
jgi:phosphoenolpyruvate-protein phosphotransferase (PTS system enzyme I)